MRSELPEPLTISVVVPVKDDSIELTRCLRALAVQSRRADEIVVVDNASTDDSAQVARDAGARVVRCDRPGIPAASAHGYDQAKGDIILRLDADCVPDRGWVQAMADAFAAAPEIAAFTGGARFTDGPRVLRTSLATAYLGAYALVLTPTLGHLPLFGSNLAFRRDVWRGIRSDVHRASPALHDDLDLAFHLGERHRIRYLRSAVMGISMRPFADRRAFTQRVIVGLRTVLVHWPRDFPPIRWARLGARRALHRISVPAAGRADR